VRLHPVDPARVNSPAAVIRLRLPDLTSDVQSPISRLTPGNGVLDLSPQLAFQGGPPAPLVLVAGRAIFQRATLTVAGNECAAFMRRLEACETSVAFALILVTAAVVVAVGSALQAATAMGMALFAVR
jgi:hypothetical protein